ncbi:hypothetical protein JCM15519_13750 [Fundidesulfovibrio butyratiphilus]
MKRVSKEWALSMVFSLVCFLALGLALTWVNIERVDMAYELRRLQTEIDAQEALISKLEVERNTLLTPERMRMLARDYGLCQARPGQIRRLSETGEELASPVLKAAQNIPEKGKKCPPIKFEKSDKAKDPGKKTKKSKKDDSKRTAREKRADGKNPA